MGTFIDEYPRRDVEVVCYLVVTILICTLRGSPLKGLLQVPGWQVPRWWPSSGKGPLGAMQNNQLDGREKSLSNSS